MEALMPKNEVFVVVVQVTNYDIICIFVNSFVTYDNFTRLWLCISIKRILPFKIFFFKFLSKHIFQIVYLDAVSDFVLHTKDVNITDV